MVWGPGWAYCRSACLSPHFMHELSSLSDRFLADGAKAIISDAHSSREAHTSPGEGGKNLWPSLATPESMLFGCGLTGSVSFQALLICRFWVTGEHIFDRLRYEERTQCRGGYSNPIGQSSPIL